MFKSLSVLPFLLVNSVASAYVCHAEFNPFCDNPVINLNNEQTQVLLSSEKANLVPSIVCEKQNCEIQFKDINTQLQETIGL